MGDGFLRVLGVLWLWNFEVEERKRGRFWGIGGWRFGS